MDINYFKDTFHLNLDNTTLYTNSFMTILND